MVYWSMSQAQLFYNKGATFYTDPAAIVKVQGSVTNDQSGLIDHHGLIIIDSTFTNKQTSTAQSGGIYDVYINWVNSGHFKRDTSTVNLKGSNQDIKGDSISWFYNLNLLGTGTKSQYINSGVFNILNLTANELATRQDTMFLKNRSVGSLQGNFSFGSEGFVSNLDSGAFVRATNSSVAYYYPMGDKNNSPNRFRPVQISPNNSLNNEYSLSFFNYNASADTYSVNLKDSSLCTVNDKFYHNVGRISGNSTADMEFGYLPSTDNFYNTVANWRTIPFNGLLWNDIKLVSTNSTMGSYSVNKRLNWSNFSNVPYSLASIKPTLTGVLVDSMVCGGTNSIMSYTTPGNYSYDWGVSGGTFANNDSTSSAATINWNTIGNNLVYLIVTDLNTGCSSYTYTDNVVVSPGPTAGFSLNPNSAVQVGTPINVIDGSQGAVNWFYDLGNGTSANTSNANTLFYNSGDYTITQIVTDQFGCVDTLVKNISIEEATLIPNVFTPNGDGSNDEFSFNCAGCTDYHLEITDRWGVKMYDGQKGSTFWNGTNGAGNKCSDGTYFYILNLKYEDTEKTLTGFIQLIK